MLPRDALIELLNTYFGMMSAAVAAHGGEILKFIGDAMLAIFPIDAGTDPSVACAQALSAASSAKSAIEEVNRLRTGAGNAALEYGIALHVGDVMYGNIGGENRLDFTVIGPAVNLAARLEGLCAELGRDVLISEAFVTASGTSAQALGHFALKGIDRRVAVYAPVDVDDAHVP